MAKSIKRKSYNRKTLKVRDLFCVVNGRKHIQKVIKIECVNANIYRCYSCKIVFGDVSDESN